MQDLLKLARGGQVREAVREFNQRLPPVHQPAWAARLLAEFVPRYPACPAVAQVQALALDSARWAQAHAAFSTVRDLTLETERTGDESSLDLLLLAELVAKVTYNASDDDAPFKPSCGLDLMALALSMAQGSDDAALQARVQRLVELTDATPAPAPGPDLAAVHQAIARIDQQLDEQLALIVNHPQFAQLQARWRGLQQLVSGVERGDHLKVWVMNLPKPALAQSLLAHQGTRREDLPLFKKLFGESYGSFGGEPFGVIVADYGFDHRPADAALLAELAGLAAACHTVFILGPEPGGAQRGVWRALCEADAARHLLMAPPGPGEAAAPNPACALACEIGSDFAAQGWSTQAQGLLAANKLVQALMCKLRDVRAGEHANLAALSEALNAWLQTYVDARAHPADSAQGALRPLGQARVALQALDPGSGQFRMQVTVTPRHQFEGPLPRISLRTQALSWPG